MKLINTLLFISVFAVNTFAQCTVYANNGSYHVNMTVYPIALSNVIQTGGDCTFTTEMYYDLEITGNNPPSSMYTFQGRVRCAGQNRTFDLPNNGGTGVVTSANGQAPWINGNCDAYNESFCDQTVIIIQGPNVPYQEVVCNYTAPLPVELINFKGVQEENNIELSFTTASEKNNDYFTIERTTNGVDWEVVNRVKGNGTTDKASFYSVLDRNAVNGKNYYRLSQTDFDGASKIYKIIAVNYNAMSTINYTIYPNPTSNKWINIAYESKSSSPVKCFVYTMQGQQIEEYTLNASNETMQFELPSQNNIYMIELIQDNQIIARERIISN